MHPSYIHLQEKSCAIWCQTSLVYRYSNHSLHIVVHPLPLLAACLQIVRATCWFTKLCTAHPQTAGRCPSNLSIFHSLSLFLQRQRYFRNCELGLFLLDFFPPPSHEKHALQKRNKKEEAYPVFSQALWLCILFTPLSSLQTSLHFRPLALANLRAATGRKNIWKNAEQNKWTFGRRLNGEIERNCWCSPFFSQTHSLSVLEHYIKL